MSTKEEAIIANLKRAQEMVTNSITDEALKIKAFELAFNTLCQESVASKVNTQVIQTQHLVTNKPVSIVEFCARYNITNDIDRVLVFSAFLEKFERKTPFTHADVRDSYLKAREKQPTNISDKIGKNIGKGYLMEYPDKTTLTKAYALTRSGEEKLHELEVKS